MDSHLATDVSYIDFDPTRTFPTNLGLDVGSIFIFGSHWERFMFGEMGVSLLD